MIVVSPIGVSPAYYISKYTSHFSIDNYIESMEWLSKNNFSSLQLEIFHYEQLDQWTFNNIKKLKESLDKYDLKASQFVAHFLMNCLQTVESIKSDRGIDELEFLSVIINQFSLTDTITVPVPPFYGNVNDRETLFYFEKKLKHIENIGKRHNLKIALEPQPGSLAADLKYLNSFESLGLNLDPGHLLCSGIDPFSLGDEVLKKVYATHLCENDGVTNLSLAPGTFNNNWSALIKELNKNGYKGSLDIEIICKSNDVENEYTKGNLFLKKILYTK